MVSWDALRYFGLVLTYFIDEPQSETTSAKQRVPACHVASLPGVQSRGTQFLPANKTKPVPGQGIYASNAPAQTWWLTFMTTAPRLR